jgi:phospholipid/cholesterol/gamma-HCH transport system permease protein
VSGIAQGHRGPRDEPEQRELVIAQVGALGAALVKEQRGRLEEYGDQLLFYTKALAWTPRAIRRYRREIWNTLAEVVFGSGGISLIAGTVGVIAFLAFFAGTEVGIQGYASLSQIGVSKFTAFISAYFNTREVAPLVSSIALAATVGCGYTARLGAMRISEEIDALEVMGVPSLPFLVTTRIIAAFLAVIPLYIVALFASYLSPRLITTLIYHQSSGTYDHYFIQFLPPIDIVYSFGKLIVLAVAIILIHCYFGYTASGGPAGVGMAVGRAIRTSIVTVVVADFFLTFAIWGSTTTVRITG